MGNRKKILILMTFIALGLSPFTAMGNTEVGQITDLQELLKKCCGSEANCGGEELEKLAEEVKKIQEETSSNNAVKGGE